MYTTSDSLTFSATNSTFSAYCRFKYNRQFFTRFRVAADSQAEGSLGPQGQVNAKVCMPSMHDGYAELTYCAYSRYSLSSSTGQ